VNTISDNKPYKKTKAIWKDRLKLAIMIVAIYAILNLFGIGDPTRFLTGISCPGCGMTRAVLAAMRLQFSQAFYYHPLFGIVPLMFALYLFDYKLKPQHVKYIWIFIIAVFLLVYFIRLIILNHDIVSIDISSGFVLKFIQNKILGG
jgi:hypothetical protein